MRPANSLVEKSSQPGTGKPFISAAHSRSTSSLWACRFLILVWLSLHTLARLLRSAVIPQR